MAELIQACEDFKVLVALVFGFDPAVCLIFLLYLANKIKVNFI